MVFRGLCLVMCKNLEFILIMDIHLAFFGVSSSNVVIIAYKLLPNQYNFEEEKN